MPIQSACSRFLTVTLFVLAAIEQLAAAGTPTVEVVPSKASVTINSSFTFTAYAIGLPNQKVNWLVNGVVGGNSKTGTIASGVYQGPATVPGPNTVSIQAQSQANTSILSTPSTVTLSNPTPSTSSISPNPIPYGPFTLTVNGSGFVPGAQVNYGSSTLPTIFVSATKLTATGTAAPIVGAMTAITVVNPGASPVSSTVMGVALTQPNALVTYASAFHFLEQATFGPTPVDIDLVQKIGLKQWLVQQTAAPISPYTPNAPDLTTLQSDFFYNALTGPDQLRQRVELALSEIFVISGFKDYQASQFEPYLQILQSDAFGNFYTLMSDISMGPAMGFYLDMANNVKGSGSTLPNENYARELMQLFTTGPVVLNSNGTPQLDSSGNTIPLYTEATIQNFARCYTGWTFPVAPGATPKPINPGYFTGSMVAWEANHDTGTKTLLNNAVLPAGQTAEQDLQGCLQNIFNNANVGPFVSSQLIQHLVSSNPSPAYVQRVARVFNKDGTGSRGNLKAVIEAILLDPEARASDSASTWIPTGGHLREPVLFLTSVLRSLDATASGSNLLCGMSQNMGQSLFYPESVASYFPPSYTLPGSATILGPEFGTLNSSSGLARVNWINGVSWGGTSSPGVTLDLSPFLPLTADPTGATLLRAVNNALMAGQMPQPMQSAIAGAIASSSNYPPGQVAAAIYLTASSGLYQVQR